MAWRYNANFIKPFAREGAVGWISEENTTEHGNTVTEVDISKHPTRVDTDLSF